MMSATPEKKKSSTEVAAKAKKPGFNRFNITDQMINAFKLPEIIKKLLQVTTPPKATKLSVEDLHVLLHLTGARYRLTNAPLLEVSAPINICGDIHGQYGDLLRIFRACGAATKSKYLFLGDYIDRGRHSLEVITLLFALKLAAPKNVHLLRGNHELKAINKNYGFFAELRARYRWSYRADDALFNHFNEVFTWMPLAAVVSKRILCMHGGISPHLKSLDDIRAIPLPLETAKTNPLACDLLWADPDIGANGFEFNKTRGISHIFGENEINAVCKALDIDMIIRAHQVVEFGYAFFAGKRLVTVFSASRYQEDLHNYAAVVQVTQLLEIGFVQLKPEEYEKRRDGAPDAQEEEKTKETQETRHLSLSAEPPICVVPAAGGSSTHKLVNGGADKLIFKIKSSNNTEYRFSPVYGFVEPSGSKDIVVTRTAGAPKEDKLVILFAPAPADATDAQAAFATIEPTGTITIPLSATA